MSKIQFVRAARMDIGCPACGRRVMDVFQSGDSVEYEFEAELNGGDTLPCSSLPPYCFGVEYHASCIFYTCRHCGVKLGELELCVPSECNPGREFWYDGFETQERSELLHIPEPPINWRCVRKHSVDDQMGELARLYKRFDIHSLGLFIADFSPSNDGSPMKVWKDACDLFKKYGPACIEYMREWREANNAYNSPYPHERRNGPRNSG